MGGNYREAAERFFRKYSLYNVEATPDGLFDLLNSAHSLNDRLANVTEGGLVGLPEFVALKPLRNLMHHETEVQHRLCFPRVDSVPLTTDLMVLCLVHVEVLERALEGVPQRRRPDARTTTEEVFHQYGDFVNINPAIFNLAVHIFEIVHNLPEEPSGEAYEDFRASYEHEEANGYPHFVDGRLYSHAGSVDETLRAIVAEMQSAS